MDEENNSQPEVTNNAPVGDNKKFNIAALVLGIIALIGTCYWYVNFPCSILAIVFSVKGKGSEGRGMGMAGRVLGIVAMVLYLVIILLGVLGIAALMGSGALNELDTSLYNY